MNFAVTEEVMKLAEKNSKEVVVSDEGDIMEAGYSKEMIEDSLDITIDLNQVSSSTFKNGMGNYKKLKSTEAVKLIEKLNCVFTD